jgi:hypothetical protein
MTKLLNAIKGLYYLINNTQTLDPRTFFEGKRIAIVGPADSAYVKDNGSYIDSFDYVIRINKAPHSWNSEKSKFIGSKTDLWFHSFFENKESGGGKLDLDLIQDLHIKYLINPRTDFEAWRRTFNFYKKYNQPFPIYHLPTNLYDQIQILFPEGLKPTIGFTALASGLKSNCAELFITGFTFFKTPYAKGYRDHLLDMEENKKHFKKQGIHDADLEFELFQKSLIETKCDKVILDSKLQEILDSQ